MILTLALALLPQTTVFPSRTDRPRDPWVFRSVLDGRPRMVTLALSKEMWVAYDASNCGLYKAWGGGVSFEGAVYTSEHGPQPSSVGNSYTEGLAGEVWQAEVGGKPVATKAVWRGYELARGRAVLHYDVLLPDGRKVAVREVPESARLFETALVGPDPEATRPELALERQFVAEGLAGDVQLTLRVRIDGDPSMETASLEEPWTAAESGPGSGPRLNRLVMTADRPRAALILRFPPREESAPAAAPAGTDGEVGR